MEQVPTVTWILIGFLVVILLIPVIPDDEDKQP